MYRTIGEIKHDGTVYPPGVEFPEGAATSEQILSLIRVGSLVEAPITGSQASVEPTPEPEKRKESSVATPPLEHFRKKGGRR